MGMVEVGFGLVHGELVGVATARRYRGLSDLGRTVHFVRDDQPVSVNNGRLRQIVTEVYPDVIPSVS